MLGNDTLRGLGDYDRYETMATLYARSGTSDPTRPDMLYADTKSLMCDDILVKVDRASMARNGAGSALPAARPPGEMIRRARSLRATSSTARFQEGAAQGRSKHLHSAGVLRPRQSRASRVPLNGWLRGEMKPRTSQRLLGATRSRVLGDGKLKTPLARAPAGPGRSWRPACGRP